MNFSGIIDWCAYLFSDLDCSILLLYMRSITLEAAVWPVFLLVGILCMILSVRMQEILWSVSWVFWASVAFGALRN